LSYKNLEIWKISRELAIDIHEMSLSLPKIEMFEIGSQIRRSAKSIKANIVEGYGRRSYKNEIIKFLVYPIASKDETVDQLETLYGIKSLKNKNIYEDLHQKPDKLGKMLNGFLNS
jgi:four helix bundle protein